MPEGEEYEQAKEGLRVELQAQRANQRVQEWLRELRENAEIDVKDPLLKAIWHVASGEYLEAIEYYKVAETQSPNDGYINYSMGNVYQVLGDTEQAIEQFRLATSKNPYDPELHYALGIALIEAERQDEGVESLLTAASGLPTTTDSFPGPVDLSQLGYTDGPTRSGNDRRPVRPLPATVGTAATVGRRQAASELTDPLTPGRRRSRRFGRGAGRVSRTGAGGR